MILSVSHPLRDKTTSQSRQLRVYAPLLTHIPGASFSSSDAEDSTMLSEVWGTQQLQRSCRAESFVTLRSEILGAFRHSSSGIGEQPLTGIKRTRCSEHLSNSRADTGQQTLPQCDGGRDNHPCFSCECRHNPQLSSWASRPLKGQVLHSLGDLRHVLPLMDWDLLVLPGYLGQETEYGQADCFCSSRDSLSCGPSLQLHTHISIRTSSHMLESDKSSTDSLSDSEAAGEDLTEGLTERASSLARPLWKGQSLWLERWCVLNPHAAHFSFPWGFPLP